MIEGQGPTMLAVGAGGGCLDIFFTHLSFLFSFSLSLGDSPIWTEILSPRAVKPKTTNQPTFRYETKIAEFANGVDLDEVAHHEPPHLDLHCLPSCL